MSQSLKTQHAKSIAPVRQTRGMRLAFLVAVGFLFSPFGAQAAEILSWKDLANKAIEANPDLNAYRSRVRALEFDRRATFAGFLPRLSAFAQRLDEHQSLDFPALDTDRKTDTWGFQAQLSLFSGFSTVSDVARASAARDTAKADLRIRSADLRVELRRAYFGALLARRRVKLAERVLERRTQNRAFMKLKYEGGSEALWSLQQADADLEAARVRLESERLNLDNSLVDLKRVLHLSPDAPLDLRDDLDSLLKPIADSDSQVAALLDQHPDLQTFDRQIERSRAESRLAQSEFYPNVSVSYQWDRADADNSEPLKESSVLLKVEFPFFTGLSTFHTVQRYNAQTYTLESTRLAVRDTVRARLLKAIKSYDTSLLSLPLSSLQLKAAEARATTVTSQYRLGLRRYLEWEDAQSKLILAEQNAIQVRADALTNLVEWERASGLGLEDP